MPDLPVFVLMCLHRLFLILTSVTVSVYLGAIHLNCHHFISLGRQSLIRNYLNGTYHIISYHDCGFAGCNAYNCQSIGSFLKSFFSLLMMSLWV